ncbi:helix-turn-helix domain-containing protein [Streptomyces flavochromogenes]|uniref:Helix-turn-helix domain-containing protein n=1 Tax=Streptomyces flavochromogenes TaxID=68199 RepID=A0ABW6XJN9_9ACTN
MGKSKDIAVEEFSVRLRALKTRGGRSYEALARRLNVSASTLHRYCSGETVPEGFAVIARMARLCGADEAERRALEDLWTRADQTRRPLPGGPGGPDPLTDPGGPQAPAAPAPTVGPGAAAGSAGAVGAAPARESDAAAGPEGAAEPAGGAAPGPARRPDATPGPVAAPESARAVPSAPAPPPGPAPAPPGVAAPDAGPTPASPPPGPTASPGTLTPVGPVPPPAPAPRGGRARVRRGVLVAGAVAAVAALALVLVLVRPGASAGPGATPAPPTPTPSPTTTSAGTPAPAPAPAPAPPFTWTADSHTWENGCGHTYLVDRAPSGVAPPPPPADAAPWAGAHGAVHGGETLVRISLQGRSPSASVVLQALHVRVVGRTAPLPWTAYRMDNGCGGAVTPRHYAVDLDASRPLARPVDGYDASGSEGRRIPAVPFPYTVTSSDPEELLVTAGTTGCDCRWYLELVWSSEGRSGTVRIADSAGRPFRTSGIKGRPVQEYDVIGRRWITGEGSGQSG